MNKTDNTKDLRQRKENQAKFKKEISNILEKNGKEILEQYYDEYCHHISKVDRKKRSVEELRYSCMPVKQRFSVILKRFVKILRSDWDEYDIKESERDQEYALRFIVPGRHGKLDSHDIIKITEPFYNIATSVVMNQLKKTHHQGTGEDVLRLMNRLTMIIAEDLWVGSVIGLRYQHSQIQQLLSKLMMLQEGERQALWRELHDDFLQSLAIIPLKLDIIERLGQEDLLSMKEELNSTKTIVGQIIRDIRELGHGYNLSWAAREGFFFNLKRFVRLFEQRYKIPVLVNINTTLKNMSGFPCVTFFRIIQEALHNVGKHSKATYTKLTVSINKENIVANIKDNGIGFDTSLINYFSFKHLGLSLMRERIEMLNGSLKIDSVKNNGTTVVVKVPLKTLVSVMSHDN